MKKTRILMNVIFAWLIGIALSMSLKSITMITDIQSNTVFVAELSKNVLPGQRITAESLLSDLPMVNRSSVELISAQKAQQTMKVEMPEIAYMANNPFRDIITFRTKGMSNDQLPGFLDEITNIQSIEAVYYDEELLAAIPHSIRKIRSGLIVISLLVLIGAISALILRIKRDLRAHEENIKIMSLAGSEDSEIIATRRNWSIKWGALSALLAAFLTMINILFINKTLLNDLEITFLQGLIATGIMIALVILLHAITSQIILKTYLSKINPNITK